LGGAVLVPNVNTAPPAVFSTPLPEACEGGSKNKCVTSLHLLKVQFYSRAEPVEAQAAACRASAWPQPVLSYLPFAAQVI